MAEVVFDKSFALRVVALLLRSSTHAPSITMVLQPQWIEDDALADIAEAAMSYVRQFKKLPTKFVLSRELGQDVVRSPIFKKLMSIGLADAQYVMQHFFDFCQERALTEAVIAAAQKIKDGSRVGLVEGIQQALAVGTDLSTLGTKFSEVKSRAERYRHGDRLFGVLPTGFQHIDALMHGGLAAGELGVIMAAAKKGKSFGLMNIGYHNVVSADPKRVAHASFELSEDQILKRYDLRISGKYAPLLQNAPKEFVKRLKKNHTMLRRGDVRVKYWPTRKCSVNGLRAWLDALETADNFVPDLLIVDYGDIMRPDRRIGEARHEQAGIFEDLRQLAGERVVPVWTATQANRSAVSKKTVRIEDVAESFEKCQIADAVLTFCATPDETAEKKMRIFLAAMRRSVGEITVDARYDFERGYIKTTGWPGAVSDDAEAAGKSEDAKDAAIEAAMESVATVRKNKKVSP
jgi:replicative DNA helicase